MTSKPSYEDLEKQVLELGQQLEKAAARQGDEKYRLLFEKSKDAILIIENDVFVDCNQSAVDLLGYADKADFLKKHPVDLSPRIQGDGRDSYLKAKEMVALALKNGSHRFEWDQIKANGQIFPVEVLLTIISYEKNNRVIHTIWRDITHRNQMEKARQKESETLSTILESTPHGIALIDNNGTYLYVNPYFTTITGYTREDIPTKAAWFKKAYPDEQYRKHVSEKWHYDSAHAGTGKSREFKIVCKNGQSKQIEFRSSFLENQMISVLTDITERKQAEEMIREKDKLQGVLELSGAVCHEMNQPLMSLQGYFELMLMDMPQDHPLQGKIDKIQTQINRLTAITRKLMEISRYKTKDYLTEKIVDLANSSRS